MIDEPDIHRDAYASVIAAGLTGVVDELHTIDPIDLVSFIRFGSFSALEDLLQSSTELFFKEGTLRFGWTAGVDLSWNDIPKVTLGMEFHHHAVSVFFNLSLRAFEKMVEIAGIRFDTECLDSGDRLRYLSDAIADAHLPRRVAAPSVPSGQI